MASGSYSSSCSCSSSTDEKQQHSRRVYKNNKQNTTDVVYPMPLASSLLAPSHSRSTLAINRPWAHAKVHHFCIGTRLIQTPTRRRRHCPRRAFMGMAQYQRVMHRGLIRSRQCARHRRLRTVGLVVSRPHALRSSSNFRLVQPLVHRPYSPGTAGVVVVVLEVLQKRQCFDRRGVVHPHLGRLPIECRIILRERLVVDLCRIRFMTNTRMFMSLGLVWRSYCDAIQTGFFLVAGCRTQG